MRTRGVQAFIASAFSAYAIFSSLALAQGDRFGTVPLSLDDIVNVYNVPIDKKPAHKWEWTSDNPAYFRWVWEEKKLSDKTWVKKWDYKVPVAFRKATLIYILDPIDITSAKNQMLQLRVIAGGENSPFRMSVGSTISVPSGDGNYSMESFANDPNGLLIVTCGDVQNRLRWERSPTPFPK